jgi:glycosyltransferase involved in cell wall biosynthesis
MNSHFLIPGEFSKLTGGYVYDRYITAGLIKKGHNVTIHQLEEDFPFPGEKSIDQCAEIFRQIPAGEPVIIDSLAFGPMYPVLSGDHGKHPIVALMHLPLTLNPGYSSHQKNQLKQMEKSAFPLANKIVVTSEYTARMVSQLGVSFSDIEVIIPGVEAIGPKPSYPSNPRRLLCVASYLPSKGQDILIKALSPLISKDWILDCYGQQDLDRDYVTSLFSLVRDNNLNDRVFIHGPASGEELSAAYLDAELFILPSVFETYGMVLTEALAHGVPVITTTGGGIPETVPPSMGKFFNPGDVYALHSILESLLENSVLYGKLTGEAAKYHIQAHSWKKSIKAFENLLVRKIHIK